MCEFSSEREVEGEMFKKVGRRKKMDDSRRQIFFSGLRCFSGLFPLLTVLSGFLGNSPFLPTMAKTQLGKVRSSKG